MKKTSTVKIILVSQLAEGQGWEEIEKCNLSPNELVLVGKRETGLGPCPVNGEANLDTGICWANCEHRS